MKRAQRGFTLIELMIVVAVVGILSAIAYPSYTSYVLKARRGDAKAALTELSQWMERNYTTSGAYNKDSGGTTIVTASLPYVTSPKTGTATNYNLSFTAAPTASAFTLQAVPVGGQLNDLCGTLTLDNTGAKTSIKGGVAVADCW